MSVSFSQYLDLWLKMRELTSYGVEGNVPDSSVNEKHCTLQQNGADVATIQSVTQGPTATYPDSGLDLRAGPFPPPLWIENTSPYTVQFGTAAFMVNLWIKSSSNCDVLFFNHPVIPTIGVSMQFWYSAGIHEANLSCWVGDVADPDDTGHVSVTYALSGEWNYISFGRDTAGNLFISKYNTATGFDLVVGDAFEYDFGEKTLQTIGKAVSAGYGYNVGMTGSMTGLSIFKGLPAGSEGGDPIAALISELYTGNEWLNILPPSHPQKLPGTHIKMNRCSGMNGAMQ